ncbi:hypothetical protein [Gymnodinialimonas ulvae]|uniref:hypothetical protein n=1 Tax=Gymnodinialimonas ulvae TaxID=3126504 RepID=UPI0030B39C69
MKHSLMAAAALATMIAAPAAAEQFAVRIDEAYQDANPRLMQTLHVTLLERFTENGAHYVVIDAPGVAYVEAFILAINRDAVALSVLAADWTNPTMQHLSPAQRLGFLQAIECEFCVS